MASEARGSRLPSFALDPLRAGLGGCPGWAGLRAPLRPGPGPTRGQSSRSASSTLSPPPQTCAPSGITWLSLPPPFGLRCWPWSSLPRPGSSLPLLAHPSGLQAPPTAAWSCCPASPPCKQSHPGVGAAGCPWRGARDVPPTASRPSPCPPGSWLVCRYVNGPKHPFDLTGPMLTFLYHTV